MRLAIKSIALAAALLTAGLSSRVMAYTAQWTQFDWSAPSLSTAVHPGDTDGWTAYDSKSSIIAYTPGTGLSIASGLFNLHFTNDSSSAYGFNSAGSVWNKRYFSILGSGDEASLSMGAYPGNASNGSFDSATYVNGTIPGINVAGSVITVNTDTGPEYGVFNFSSFYLRNSITMNAIGANPLIIRVTGDFRLDGILNASSPSGATPGAGGGAGGTGNLPGSGVGAAAGSFCGFGQGGAGYGGAGGNGSSLNGGIAYGNPKLPIMMGGSGAGGVTCSGTGSGRGGGGSIYVVAGTSITITATGSIRSNGNAGFMWYTTAVGGSSGGDILLYSPIFVNSGSLQAVGGNGGYSSSSGLGGGGGGGGIIRIETLGYTNSGTINVAGGAKGVAGAGDGGVGIFSSDTIRNSSQTYTSSVIDLGGPYDLYTIQWSSAIPASGGNIKMELRAGSSAVPDGEWTSWAEFQNGQDMGGGLDYLRYIQWRSSFTSVVDSTSPALNDLTISYLGYDNNWNNLNSSVYDTGSSSNSLKRIRWAETDPFPTDVNFQLRSSPDAAAWTSWMGPGGTSSTWFSDPAGGGLLPYELRDGAGDRYFQYRVALKGSGNNAPVVSVATVTYGTITEPELTLLTPQSNHQLALDFVDNSEEEDDFRISTSVVGEPVNDVGIISTADKPGSGPQSGVMSALEPNTLYFVRLRAHENSDGSYSAFSNKLSTYTFAAVPGESLSTYVPDTSLITVKWSANGNPAGTQFFPERATDQDFTAGLIQPGWTTSAQQVFAGLSLGTTYYFRVKARNAYGHETSWVVLRPGQSVAPPLTGALNVYTTSITVNWGLNGNVNYIPYQVVLADDAGFAVNPATSPWVYGSSYTFTGLTPNGLYHFRVRAATPLFDPGAWTSLGSGRTVYYPPSLAAAPVATTENRITFTWAANGNPGGTTYMVKISTDPGFAVVDSSFSTTQLTNQTGWETLANVPATINNGITAYPGSGDYIYASMGTGAGTGSGAGFHRYSISGNIWTPRASAPVALTNYSDAVYVGITGHIYAIVGNGSPKFMRYSIAGNSWDDVGVADYTSNFGAGSSLAYPGYGDHIYATLGGGTTFLKYSISQDLWSTAASVPNTLTAASLTGAGGGDYLYLGINSAFYRYSISSNTWGSLATMPAGFNTSGAASYPGFGDTIYGQRGNQSGQTQAYSMSGNSWNDLAFPDLPGQVGNYGNWGNSHRGLVPARNYLYQMQAFYNNVFWRYKIDDSVLPNATSYVRITAVNSDGYESPPIIYTAVSYPDRPAFYLEKNLIYTGVDFDRFTVNWQDTNAPYEAEHQVQLATEQTFASPAGSGWLTGTNYEFTGLNTSTNYYVRVKARDKSNISRESAWRNFPNQATLPRPPSPLGHIFVSSGTVNAQWGANGNMGAQYYAERATDAGFTQNVSGSGWTANLSVGVTVSPNTFYYFRVKARSATGDESIWVNLPSVRTFANVPAAQSLGQVAGDRIRLDWQINNNPVGTEFLAEIALTSNPWSTSADSSWITAASYIFTGLAPNTTYHLRVKSRNASLDEGINSLAPAVSSYTVVLSTLTKIPPSAPSGLAVDLDGVLAGQTDRLHIKWQDNSSNESGFTLERSPDNSAFSLVLNLSAGATEYADSGLTPNTSYYYRVKAYSNDGGDSAYSNISSLHTRANSPNSVAFMQVSSVSAGVSFGFNSNPAGTLFSVLVSTDSGFTGTVLSSVTVASPGRFSGLIPNTTYYARTQATNNNGITSPLTSNISTMTAAAQPGSVVFQPMWITSAAASWTAGANPGYTRYTAQVSTASDFTGTLVSSVTRNASAELPGLSPNATYYLRVRAANEANTPTAWISPAVPAPTLAYAPAASGLSYIVNASSVTIFWDTAGNPAWTQYSAQRSGRDSAAFASVEDSSLWQTGRSSWTFYSPSLTAGATYYFRVKARNSAGVEAPFGAGNWVVLPSTQTKPNLPGLVPAEVFVSSMNARWVNTNQAGTPYLTEISELSDYSVLTASSGWINDIASYMYTGLNPNSRYYVRARARNSSGLENATVQLYSEYTRAAPPAQPSAEYTRTGNSVTASWDKNGNPDPETEYYAVASSSSDFSYGLSNSGWLSANSWQFNGLLPGTEYFFRAKARNRNATPLETAWTVLPSTFTLPAPNPPSALAVTYVDADSTDRLRLDWTDNSADEAGFRIYVSADGSSYGIDQTLGSNPGTGALNYLVMGLDPNRRYFYKVAAFNPNGEAYSAVISTYSRAALPGALDFSQVLTNSLRLNWGPGVNPAGTRYSAEISTMATFAPLTASSVTVLNTALLTGIEANTVYYGRVRAINGSGVPTDYVALGSTQTIPLSMTITAMDQAPAGLNQGQRASFAKVVLYPSGDNVQLTGLTVRRTGNGADQDASRVALWRDQNGDGGFQAGNDLEVGYAVFAASQAVIVPAQVMSQPTTFFVVLTVADNFLSWPGNNIGLTITSTASFTSPNSLLASMAPAPLNSGVTVITKIADVLDVFGNNAAPVSNVSRGVYNTPFLKLTLNAQRDRAYLNRLAVRKLGTLADSEIDSVKIYYDANKNGTLEAGGGDQLISSGIDTFVSGFADIQLVNPSTRAVSNEVYFITLDIKETAPLNTTVGVRILGNSDFTLMQGMPDTLTLASSPTDSATPAVSDPPNTLMVTPASMGVTTVAQGEEKALLKLEMTSDIGNAVVTSLKVQRSSTSVDSDYAGVYFYRDNPPLGEYGPSDTFISSGVFASGQVTFGLAENITYTSTKTYFCVADISASASVSDRAGFSIQSGYITAISAQTAIVAPFPMYSGLSDITPTVDTVAVTPDSSIAPSVAYQTDVNVPVMALRMQADANAADISALLINQAGSAQDADISSLRVFRDDGDGLFNPAQDAPVSGNYTFSNGSAAVSFSSLQNITPTQSIYFLAASVAPAAVPGRTLQLRVAAGSSFNILAPDLISGTFPILSNSITLEKLPAVLYISSATLAPAAADAGTQNIKMERLLIRTNQSTAQLNSMSLVRAGGGDADISKVAVYWDANSNTVLELSEMVSSGTFSGGFLSLPLNGAARDLSVSTRTYYVTMDISAGSAVNTLMGITFAGLSVNSPDSVEAGRFPFNSGSVRVAEPVSQLACSFEDKAPGTAMQGEFAVLAASFTVAASAYTVDLTGLDILRTGNGYDADVAAVKIYRDDGNGTWGGPAQETMIAAGPFVGGAANLRFSTQTVSAGLPRLYYISLDISETASPGKTLGVSLPAASYMKIADPDYASLAGFPFNSSLSVINATVDTMLAVPVPLSLAPLLTQGDTRRAIGKLTLRSDANSIELSGLRFSQSGTMSDADLKEAVLYKDDGDGVFLSTTDAMVTMPTQPNGGSLQFLISPSQIITTAPQAYWLAISVSSNAAVGSTLSLDCANPSYLSVSAPDQVDASIFPFSFSVAGTLLDKPDTIRVLAENRAPAEADQGSVDNVMARLRLWTDMDQAVLNQLRVDLSGTLSPSDISAVKVYRDLDSNGQLTPPDLMLGSGTFSGGYVWLTLASPQTITPSTRTYFVTYDVSPGAPINTQALAGINGPGYLDVSAPDLVSGVGLPFTSGGMVIKEPAGGVEILFENKASTWALQGQTDVLMSSFTLSISSYNAALTQLVVGRTGTSPDADVAVVLYADDGDRLFSGIAQDLFVASAAFSGGVATLQFDPQAFNSAASKLFFLAANVASDAMPARNAGFTVAAANYFTLAAPDYISGTAIFPMVTGLVAIEPTNDLLNAQAETLGLAPLLAQGDLRRPIGKLTLRSAANSVEVSNIRFDQAGTAQAADVPEFLLYKDDGDGVFSSAADAVATLPATVSAGAVRLVFSQSQVITTVPETYWLTVSVASEAASGTTLDLRAQSTAYLTISNYDSVNTVGFPLLVQPAGTIQDKPDAMSALIESHSAPTSVYQGIGNYVLGRVKVWTAQDRAAWRRLRVDLAGNASASDVAGVALYHDADGSGLFNSSADTLVASGTFSGGYIWLDFMAPQTVNVSTATYFVVYDMSPSAAIGALVGARVSGGAYFTVDSPDLVSSAAAYDSPLATIRDPRVPVPPGIAMLRGDGTLTIQEVAYAPYETMLDFKWDGTVYQGSLERVDYYVGAAPATGASAWTPAGLNRDIRITSLNLSHGATYYLSLRAKNTLGDYYSDIVSQRFVVDSYKPLIPPGAQAREEAGGVKLTWPAAAVGPSGVSHYLVEERSAGSPVWVAVTTTSSRSMVVSRSGVSIQAAKAAGSYYYRVSPVNNAGVAGDPTEPLSVNLDLGQLAAISAASAYPNPFDSRKTQVTVAFTLNKASPVKLVIYDVFGVKVKELSLSGAAGENTARWDGSGSSGKVSKGVYLCVIKAAGDSKLLKIAVKH